MSLITCTECGKEFSDKAPACPNCGCPTSEIIFQETDTSNELSEIVINNDYYKPNEKAIKAAIDRGIIKSEEELIISCGNYYDGKFLCISDILYVTNENFYICHFDHSKKTQEFIIPLQYNEESISKCRFNVNRDRFESDKKAFDVNPKSIYDSKERLRTAYFEILKRVDEEKALNFYKIKFLHKIYCPKCNSFNVEITMQSTEENSEGTSEVRKKSIVTRTGNTVGRGAMIMATGGLWALTPKKSKYIEKKKGKTKVINKKFAICQECGNSWEIH